MSTFAIELPPIEADKTVEVTVKVNGDTRLLNYKVELFRWDEWRRPSESRAMTLKRIIERYDRNWHLMQIGAPTDVCVPVIFRQNNSA